MEFKVYREAAKKEDDAQQHLFDQLKRSQEAAAEEVKNLREENQELKKELEERPTMKAVLDGFRGTPTYYEELNDKVVEKIQLCQEVASNYLAENPGGAVDGFIKHYINLEEKIHAEKLASWATVVATMPRGTVLPFTSGSVPVESQPPPQN